MTDFKSHYSVTAHGIMFPGNDHLRILRLSGGRIGNFTRGDLNPLTKLGIITASETTDETP